MIDPRSLLSAVDNIDNEMHAYLETAILAALKVGEYLVKTSARRRTIRIESKENRNDYVTEADHESERIIMDMIEKQFPSHSFLAEESGQSEKKGEYRWIIDPLDGTTNFIHGFPVWAVSIALEKDNDLLTGVVFAPSLGEIFYASKGSGAYMNGKRIHVSSESNFSKALLLTGFPFKAQKYIDQYLAAFKELFLQCSGMRRAGSASVDLAWLACGRAEGFWEIALGPWDIAAGTLLVREAGGIVSDINGNPDKFMQTGNIIAGNKAAHMKILDTTSRILNIPELI